MFDTSYDSDFRHPPKENFFPHKAKHAGDEKTYTAYIQQTQSKGIMIIIQRQLCCKWRVASVS